MDKIFSELLYLAAW